METSPSLVPAGCAAMNSSAAVSTSDASSFSSCSLLGCLCDLGEQKKKTYSTMTYKVITEGSAIECTFGSSAALFSADLTAFET